MTPELPTDVEARAAVHAALGDPTRLAIVEQLALTDRSPSELAERFGLNGNLLAHHLDALERAGLVERVVSAGDGRRRYVTLRPDVLQGALTPAVTEQRPAVFLCTHNSARSQLAAALWTEATGVSAASAGTDPADRVHPGAVDAAARVGLDLSACVPQAVVADDLVGRLVVTVCDRAHEQLDPAPDWLHWSVADPVPAGGDQAFDRALDQIRRRIAAFGN